MNCGFFTVKRNTASEINKEMLNDIFAEFDESSRVRTNSTDREMEALAETSSWSLLLKDKSVCSKHIQKVSTRLGKKVFFKVWLVPDFIEINRKFPKALPKFAKSTCHLTLTWCWKKHPLHCLKQLRLWVLNIYSYQKCPSLLHLTTSNIL